MTDISSMTDERLNEAIAKAKGRTHPADFIDYTHSWDLCGELLEEMHNNEVMVILTNGKDFEDGDSWACDAFLDWINNINPYLYHTPQRAICEAYLAWKRAQ
jgi:hypothetical protein